MLGLNYMCKELTQSPVTIDKTKQTKVRKVKGGTLGRWEGKGKWIEERE
jgi:hypothetical protein